MQVYDSESTQQDTLRERKFQGRKVPGSEKAGEQKDQGVKVPGSEMARVLLADSLWERIGPGVKRLGTLYSRRFRLDLLSG